MSDLVPEDQKRMDRKRRSRLLRRAAVVAVVIALLIAASAGGYKVWQTRREIAAEPPQTLVVIAESELEDGTKVAGAITVVERVANDVVSVTAVDPLAEADIPGTSYDRLRDALSLGGADIVARLAAGKAGDEDAGWLLLDEDAWAELVDKAGGAPVEIAGTTTVFTGDRLFRFEPGSRTLTGEEAVALLRGSESISSPDKGASVRNQLAEQIFEAVDRDPRATAVMVDSGGAESSEEPETLAAFLESR